MSPEVTSAKILFPRSIPARFLLTCYVRLPFILPSLLVPFDKAEVLANVRRRCVQLSIGRLNLVLNLHSAKHQN